MSSYSDQYKGFMEGQSAFLHLDIAQSSGLKALPPIGSYLRTAIFEITSQKFRIAKILNVWNRYVTMVSETNTLATLVGTVCGSLQESCWVTDSKGIVASNGCVSQELYCHGGSVVHGWTVRGHSSPWLDCRGAQ